MIQRVKAWYRRTLAPTAPARAFASYGRRQMGDRAAAITYYAMLSLFPAMLFAVSLAGLLGGAGLVEQAVEAAEGAGLDSETQSTVRDAAQTALDSSGGALGLGLVIGLLLSLSGASSVLSAIGRALDAVFGAQVKDPRGLVAKRLQAAALTAVLVALGLVGLAALLLGGDLAHDAFDEIGLGSQASSIWSFARWPLALATTALAVSAVFRWAPAPDVRRARIFTPGALTAVVLQVALTAGFTFYLRNFGDYGAVYGAFAGAVVLLVWLNLMVTAFLLGAELDAELERPPSAAADDGA